MGNTDGDDDETIKCPACDKSFGLPSEKKNRSRYYNHLSYCLSLAERLQLRQQFIPGLQQYKCDKCNFFTYHESRCYHNCQQNLDKLKQLCTGKTSDTEAADRSQDTDITVSDAKTIVCPLCQHETGRNN